MSSRKKGTQFAGKTSLMKELQRTVAFLCCNKVLASGDSESAKVLQHKAHALHFGNANDEDSVGFAEQMVKGMGAFASMFEHEEDIAKGNVTLRMKKLYHCMPDINVIASQNPKEKGINMAVLSSKTLSDRVQITPRGVWDFGKAVEKSGKKALALVLASEHAECAKSGNRPSGKKCEDYLLWLRESMHKEFKSGGNEKDKDDDQSSDNDSGDGEMDADSAADEMKENWFFPGHIAFALWGPIMPEDMDDAFKAEAFWSTDANKKNKSGKGDKTSGGRTQARKEQEQENNANRSTASISEGRGVSNRDFLFAASVAQQSSTATMFEESRSVERRLKYYQDKVKRAEREVERWKSLITRDIMQDTNNFIYQQFLSANAKFHAAETELDTHMSSLQNEKKANQHQQIVDRALSTFNVEELSYKTPSEKKRKRSETPLSSIDVPTNALIDVQAPDSNEEQQQNGNNV